MKKIVFAENDVYENKLSQVLTSWANELRKPTFIL